MPVSQRGIKYLLDRGHVLAMSLARWQHHLSHLLPHGSSERRCESLTVKRTHLIIRHQNHASTASTRGFHIDASAISPRPIWIG